MFFSPFGPDTGKQVNWRQIRFALTCSFQKVIRALAFSGRKKFGNSCHFNFLGIVSINCNLI